ncbi:hypothetical protein Cgig2_033965 [Carnegiea gigantea]|uniref:DUF1990 domain-containing protein n=1 Tax=Carnegiea gigantea TaxID=171969 RepID=A0A9Q1QH19_9CARY|nr:hypothetical protein Cgig2_033965 [Carnegiea gigantea]
MELGLVDHLKLLCIELLLFAVYRIQVQLLNFLDHCFFLPPPPKKKSNCCRCGSFNYDGKHKGATAQPVSSLQKDKQLLKAGFLLNHACVLIGSGLETYEKGKDALQNWRHFQMSWTFVEPATPVKTGVKFCVCVKEFFPWLMMPLQIAYVNENKSTGKVKASFSFGSGTLQGHLLVRILSLSAVDLCIQIENSLIMIRSEGFSGPKGPLD